MKKNIYIFIFICIISSLILIGIDNVNARTISKKQKTSKQIKSKKPNYTKSSIRKSKSNQFTKKKSVKKSRVKYPVTFKIINDTLLADGLTYKKIEYGSKNKIHIHVVEHEIKSNNKISILKAGEQINELSKLQNIIKSNDSLKNENTFVAINANFWRAYSNSPIGPTIINGEIIEMPTHKKWSSAFFDYNGKLFIENYYLNGFVEYKGIKYHVLNVNRRRDSLGLIIYNRFSGDQIPFILKRNIDDEVNNSIKETLLEMEFFDSTEIELDTAWFRDEIIKQKQMNSLEYSMKKIAVEYLTQPLINGSIMCKIISIGFSEMKIPKNGCIISLGEELKNLLFPVVGDTLNLIFETNTDKKIKFFNAVSGTPRLVRNGIAKHEAYIEGSHGRRFINKPLSRTALGTNTDKSIIYLVAIETTVRSERKAGANLAQLANIMKKIGCYNAMNLDGGGSTVMVINGKNKMSPAKPDNGRRISVGLGISKNLINK